MSTRGDIAAWCVARLEAQVPTFADVLVVKRPEEMAALGVTPPSAGVMVTSGRDSGQPAPPAHQYVYLDVELLLVFSGFATIDHLSDDDGAYQLLDDIWTAFKGQTPVGACEPLTYVDDSLDDLGDSRVLWSVRYRTAAILS